MHLKVCILSDYREGFQRCLDRLSITNDSKVYIDDFVLSFEMCDSNKDFIDCDYLLILNKSLRKTTARARRVIALQQEPYIAESKQYALPFKNEWAIDKTYYEFCDVVFSFNEKLFSNENLSNRNPDTFTYKQTTFVKSMPYVYFLFSSTMDYKTLCNMKLSHVNKTKAISCIASFDKKSFYGHLDRIKFVNAIKSSRIGHKIDFFGNKTSHPLQDKKDGILPYKYTIVIENNSQSDYLSEKIMDAYLGYSIPIYFGAKNIDLYFPKNSFITIDIYNIEESINIIDNLLNSNFFDENIDALLEARGRVINDYSMLNALSKKIINDYRINSQSSKKDVPVNVYKRPLRYVLKRWLFIAIYNIRNFIIGGERKNKINV